MMQKFLTYRLTNLKIKKCQKRKVLRFNKDKFLHEELEDEKPKDNEGSQSKFLAMISLASELGFSISLPIAGGAILGQFLDNKFHTLPRMTLSLIFFGLFIGAANIYIIMKEAEQDSKK